MLLVGATIISWSRVAALAMPPIVVGEPPVGARETVDRAMELQQEAERAALKRYEDTIKYFREPSSTVAHPSDLLGHYDTRYFKGLLDYDAKRDIQVHLIQAYLEMFNRRHIETWIAHGTLLGWWWNAKMLPWDWDLDTQVSVATMKELAESMNNTLHTYTAASATAHPHPVTRQYLLDVNPHWTERDRGDGLNIIDARFIDTENGLYVDITAVGEVASHPEPRVWSCKNEHRYRVSDLYPMRETVFEGVVAKVPYAYDRILMEEYSQGLVLTEYEG